MGETDTDAADRYDARVAAGRLDESRPGLWGRVRKLPRNVLAISLVSLLNDASSEIIYPFLPLFLALTLGASPLAIGLIEGAAESVSGLLKLLSGYLSDRRGRRKGLVVFGYGLASAMRPLLAFASSWPQVLLIRLADRVGKGLRSAPRDAMIADAASPAERGIAFGFHRAMDHAGAVIGPLLGFAILAFVAGSDTPTADDYATLFLLASIPAAAAVLVAALLIRERPRETAPDFVPAAPSDASTAGTSGAATVSQAPAAAALAAPPRLSLRGFDSNFKRFLLVLALFTLSNSSDAFLLLRAQESGVSATLIPLLWAALHVMKVGSSLVGGDLSDRLGRKTLIVSGWLLYAAVYAGFAFASSAAEVWVLFLVYGLYFGLVEGSEKALVADLARPEQRGTAYGLYNLAFSVTVLPASLLLGALWAWRGAQTAFLTSAAVGAAAALLLALAVRAGAPNGRTA
ncbi:MAG TPA: MFS transporter [Pyrinomonadaceae bacterium]|nr:MFS transporter [Pyrinomonadaceae bacterium]